MKEKIFIEDGLSLYNKTGIGQYTQNLCELLRELDYELVAPRKNFLEKIKNSSVKRVLYVLWLNLIFPFILIFSGCKKVIFTNYLVPLYRIPTKKYYPVIHDLCAIKFPETLNNIKCKYNSWILNVVKNTYYKIITVSDTVKDEIQNFYNYKADDIKVVYNYFSFGENPEINCPQNEQTQLLEKLGIKTKQYILSVGSLNKRKNIQMLIDAYCKIQTDKKLLIVGQRDNAKLSNDNENIIFTGYLRDEELKVLYKNALIFAFPSVYEGFGIPLIDAQSFNVPVLCSNIKVFRELAGNSVQFSDLNVDDFANKLQDLLNNQEYLNELSAKGKENIKRFAKTNVQNVLKEILAD